MTTFMIHNNGEPVSVGTVVADPLPGGLTAVALSDTDADRLRTGWQWNPQTLAVDIEPPPDPEPPPPLDEVFAAVPVVSLEEANDTLLALKAALEARGIV